MKKYQPSCHQKKADQASPPWLEVFRHAVRLHQSGVSGVNADLREAAGLLEQLRKEVPENNLVRAYLGSTLCLLGRDSEKTTERSAYTVKGLKLLDQAVFNEPDNFEIRVVRGNVCVNLPEMYFHRNSTAVEDFQYLITCCELDPENIRLELYLQFLYNLTCAYNNLGQSEASESVRCKLLQESQNSRSERVLNEKVMGSGFAGTDHFFTLVQPVAVILEEGKRIHQRALSGHKKDIQVAMDFFAKALILHKDNQLFQAYHADCRSLSGRIASNTGEMFANAIKAIKAIDAAIANDPANIEIRLLRVNHSMRLPELFFARTATAITDLEYLAGRYQQQPGEFEKKQMDEIFFNLGLCYRRLGLNTEADEIWEKRLSGASAEMLNKINAYRQNDHPIESVEISELEINKAEFYRKAKHLHQLGVHGNQTAAQMALQLWKEAHAAAPADPLAQAYYGSSLALTGRDATSINEMFTNGIKGLKILNEALGRDPNNWELRLLRGYLTFSLPEVFFHSTHQAMQDFNFLKQSYEQNNHLFSKELYEQILCDLQIAVRRIEH